MIFGSLTAWFLKEVQFLNLEIFKLHACQQGIKLWNVLPILQFENCDIKEVDT